MKNHKTFKLNTNYSFTEIRNAFPILKEYGPGVELGGVIGESFIVAKSRIDDDHVHSFILVSATAVHFFYRLIYKYTC